MFPEYSCKQYCLDNDPKCVSKSLSVRSTNFLLQFYPNSKGVVPNQLGLELAHKESIHWSPILFKQAQVFHSM